jgi:diguanylate cyclase (GGDEF)-like protein
MLDLVQDHELQRLAAIERYALMDVYAEQSYNDIMLLASQIFQMPIVLISLVEKERQWFRSKIGLEVDQTPIDQSFCAHAILNSSEVMSVEDATQDSRFATNPLVLGDPNIRFYAGAPLVTPDGYALGTLCVIDRVPNRIQPAQAEALRALSRLVVNQFEMRRIAKELQNSKEDMLQTNQQLGELLMTDTLTKIPNRRALEKRSEEEFSRASRSQTPISMLMVDIDKFKSINDQYGHARGDLVLERVAALLRSELRPHDFVARYGGEEFCVILPEIGLEAVMIVAERLRKMVEKMDCDAVQVTISVGVATQTFNSSTVATWTDLQHRADLALYRAKERGRNCCVD